MRFELMSTMCNRLAIDPFNHSGISFLENLLFLKNLENFNY